MVIANANWRQELAWLIFGCRVWCVNVGAFHSTLGLAGLCRSGACPKTLDLKFNRFRYTIGYLTNFIEPQWLDHHPVRIEPHEWCHCVRAYRASRLLHR
jgi:hypothetical protein